MGFGTYTRGDDPLVERKWIKEDSATEIFVTHMPGAKARRRTELRFARG